MYACWVSYRPTPRCVIEQRRRVLVAKWEMGQSHRLSEEILEVYKSNKEEESVVSDACFGEWAVRVAC